MRCVLDNFQSVWDRWPPSCRGKKIIIIIIIIIIKFAFQWPLIEWGGGGEHGERYWLNQATENLKPIKEQSLKKMKKEKKISNWCSYLEHGHR